MSMNDSIYISNFTDWNTFDLLYLSSPGLQSASRGFFSRCCCSRFLQQKATKLKTLNIDTMQWIQQARRHISLSSGCDAHNTDGN